MSCLLRGSGSGNKCVFGDIELLAWSLIGLMKGGLSVGRRPEILHNVRRRLGNETVCVELKWSVKCRVTNSECQCQATLIFG